MTPTPEQLHIIELARQGGSLKVNAFAGTGKTTTLGLLADAHPAKKFFILRLTKILRPMPATKWDLRF
jgi:hypothetical protein